MREGRQPVMLARRLRRSMTPQEVKLWNWLREGPVIQGFHFRRQMPLGRFIVDFACVRARLVVEIDGSQHGSDRGRLRDGNRDRALTALGFQILRFWNHEVDFEKTVVMDTIHAALERALPPPSPAATPPPRAGEDRNPPDPSPRAGRVAGAAGRVGNGATRSSGSLAPPSPAATPPPQAGEDRNPLDPSPLAGRAGP